MTYVEFNLIRVISAGIITAAISTAYCSFAYLFHGPLLNKRFLSGRSVLKFYYFENRYKFIM